MLRDFLIALSLCNLWFLKVWRWFLTTPPRSTSLYYHWKANPAPILLGTMLDISLLALVLLVAVTLARHSRKRWLLKIARLVFLLMFFILLIDLLLMTTASMSFGLLIDTLLRHPERLFTSSPSQALYLWLGLLGLIVAFALITILFHRLAFRREQLIRIVTALLLILSPFVLVTFSQAASQWIVFKSGDKFREEQAPSFNQERQSNRRVVWIIFDELDFRLSFLDRPSSVHLPAFDRLYTEAVFAQNAYPPGGDTVLSLPSLITGRLVSWSHRTAANELTLTFADNNQTVPWNNQPNVFSRARAMELNTALAGWYHPYCRIIGNSLTKCSWEATRARFLPNKEIAKLIAQSGYVSVTTSMFRIAEAAVLPESIRIFIAAREGRIWRRFDIENYQNVHQQALTLASDPNLQLILIHYSIPHPPGIFDRSKHDFSTDSSSGYLDNLELADRTVADLRQEMEQAGLWESTTMLISSDHRLRADRLWRHNLIWQAPFTKVDPIVFNSVRDERVPFVLKMAGEKTALSYEPAFNTVLSHDLMLAILSGAVLTEADVAQWLDQHRSIGQSPYIEGER